MLLFRVETNELTDQYRLVLTSLTRTVVTIRPGLKALTIPAHRDNKPYQQSQSG